MDRVFGTISRPDADGELIDYEVEIFFLGRIYGQHIPATLIDPEEFPEVELELHSANIYRADAGTPDLTNEELRECERQLNDELYGEAAEIVLAGASSGPDPDELRERRADW